jgi:hypothetical protein
MKLIIVNQMAEKLLLDGSTLKDKAKEEFKKL